MKSQIVAGIYSRLSREDTKNGKKDVSVSIENQRKMLEDYCNERGWKYYSYEDDDFSGVNFDRPSFQRMIRDMKAGNINCIVTKDLSRFGRNVAEGSRYRDEVFPEYGVRFVTLDGQYDSENEDNDIAPFIDVFKNIR